MSDRLEDALAAIAAKIEAEIVDVVAYETGVNPATRPADEMLAGVIEAAKDDCMAVIQPLIESLIENTGCDHTFVRDGEVKRPLGGGSYQVWNKYICTKCVKPRFALVYEWNQYALLGGAHDGTSMVDSVEALP